MLSPDQKLKARAKRLAKYGETLESYAARLKAQNGVCAICGRPPKNLPLNVDHDHELEKKHGVMFVRGLLCAICNHKILGVIERFRVPPQKIVDYLTAAREQYEKNFVVRLLMDSAPANRDAVRGGGE